MTDYIFLWENPDGERRWEAVEKSQTNGFLKVLLDNGVNPATVMAASASSGILTFNWVWKKYHSGRADVPFRKINDEIHGTEPVAEEKHIPVTAPKREWPESKLGWLAPDGKFYPCVYGGHISLARDLAKDIRKNGDDFLALRDPELFLEERGWARISRGTSSQYVISMGVNKKLTDKQTRALLEMNLTACGLSDLC